jgi:hypothetical protein
LTAALDLSVGRKITVGSVLEMGANIRSNTYDGLYLSPAAYLSIGADGYGKSGVFIGNIKYTKITPNMTSDSQNGYILTNSVWEGVTYLAFDGNDSTSLGLSANDWVKVQLPSAETVTHLRFYIGSNESFSYKLEGSNDDSNWSTVDTGSFECGNHRWSPYFAVSSPDSYTYYKFTITASDTGEVPLYELELCTPESGTGATDWKMSLVADDNSHWFKWEGSGLDIKTENFNLVADDLELVSGIEPHLGLGVTSYDSNSGIYLGKDGSAWKMSMKNSDGSNYLKWTGSALEILGNYIVKEGYNFIKFADSDFYFFDHGYDSGVGIIRFDDVNTNSPIFKFSKQTEGTNDEAHAAFRITNNSYSDSDSHINELHLEVHSDANTEAGNYNRFANSIYNAAGNNAAVFSIYMRRLSSSTTYGYFEFDAPIKILYAPDQNASDMPKGTILTQGNYLFYRANDASGTWYRVQATADTPS